MGTLLVIVPLFGISLSVGAYHIFKPNRKRVTVIEEWVDYKTLYTGRVVSLRVGNARLEDGAIALREVVEHPGGVGVIPVHEGQVILVRQYRIAVGQHVLEIPAGKLEPGDSPETRGQNELEEETGYHANQLISAGSVYATVGYSSEEIHLFLAFDLEHVGQNLEDDERVELVRIPLEAIPEMLACNAFKDAKTVVGLYALLQHLKQDMKERKY